jgi:16S rRNA (guanine527-N7)-methyltransferase
MEGLCIGSKPWLEIVMDGARQLGVTVTVPAAQALAGHAGALLQWNRKTNLTAITGAFEVAVKHMVDSLAPVPWIAPGGRLLDIGSGGGFPGIPLKILLPLLDVTLIDAVRRKVSFLQHVIRAVNLSGIRAIHVRAQELAAPGQGVTFDVIISRALTSIDDFIPMALPLLAPGGMILAMRGKTTPQDLDAVRTLRDGLVADLEIVSYRLPFLDDERSLVLLRR